MRSKMVAHIGVGWPWGWREAGGFQIHTKFGGDGGGRRTFVRDDCGVSKWRVAFHLPG